MLIRYLSAFLAVFLLSFPAAASDETVTVSGFSSAEALKLGEIIYREGVLPSGEPMKAIVMGDIPVDGRIFTCDDCHQRSGLGSVEGTVITWPTNGKDLYIPRRRTGAWRPPESEEERQSGRKALPPYWQVDDVRPAYTDETLARVLRIGVDPGGRKLDPVMPRYMLSPPDMDILIHYLKNLSVDFSPGVDETTLRFATVVSERVPSQDRTAMLLTLQAHIEVHNSQSRHQERRAASGPFYKTEMHQAYRRFKLDVWELLGPEDTWPAQLQAYYEKEPVFALLGGITEGSWKPVHDFCEQRKIPSIFPVTDFPVVSESDWYTLYFSKGLHQEGESAVRYLNTVQQMDKDASIVQVYRVGREGLALARGVEETLKKLGRPSPVNTKLDADQELTASFWKELTTAQRPDVLLLWLNKEDLAFLSSILEAENRPQMIFVSTTLSGTDPATIPEALRDTVFLTHPYSTPGMKDKQLLVVKRWLQARDIPLINLTIQAKMYFLGWMLPGSVKRMRSEFFREYFLEGFDMMSDQDYAIAVYPRLTFGPGQRYASKGCYIVQFSEGENPELVKRSDWVIH